MVDPRPAPAAAARAAGPSGPIREEPALNADPTVQVRLLDVQALDARLDQLAHRRRTLPEIAEAGTLDERLRELADQVVFAETEVGDLERERRKADADVEQVRARAARDQQRLDSGQVGSARDLENLQRELASLARRQSDLEDVELEIMEKLEVVQANADALTEERSRVEAEHTQVAARRDEAFAAIDGEAGTARTEREQIAGDVAGDLLTLYERIREQQGGVGAAALRHGRCEGCRLQLTATELGRLRGAPADEVLRCEECRRILVRLPDSGL